jgi:hypothetical protein
MNADTLNQFVPSPAVAWLESEEGRWTHFPDGDSVAWIRPMFEVLTDDPEPQDTCSCGGSDSCPVGPLYPDPSDTDRWVWL